MLPYWPRRRRIIEADVVARTGQLSQGGWAATLNDLRPGMRWLGESRLQINAYDYPPLELSGAQLMFVPVTSRQGWVSWDALHRYAVVYPCSGPLAEAGRSGPKRAEPRCRRPWARCSGGRPRPPRHPEEHDTTGGPHQPGPGVGGPPSQGPARRPPGPAPTCRAVHALLPNGRRRGPGESPKARMRTHAKAGPPGESPESVWAEPHARP